MMHDDQVVILLATYQGARFLGQQLDSLMSQSYPHFRLFIRDDGSSDGTQNLIQSYARLYPEKIHLLPPDRRLGVVGNFQRLMEEALGQAPYIMFCDQDDLWEKDKILKTLMKMKQEEDQRPCLVHTDLCVVDQELKPLHPSFWRYCHLKPKGRESFNRLLVQNVVTGCTVMINQALLKQALPIPSQAMMHDWWLALVASAFGKVVHLQESAILYRQHSRNQLGAQKFGSFQHLRAKWRGLSRTNQALFDQARFFHIRYQEELDQDLKEVLNDFLNIPAVSFVESRRLIWKRAFFKHGLLRNLFFNAIGFR